MTTERMMELKGMFTHHPPKDNQPQRYAMIRSGAFDFAQMIENSCPQSREKSLAITKLQEAVMFANAAIAINE